MTHRTINRRRLVAGSGIAVSGLALGRPSSTYAMPQVARSFRRAQGDPVKLQFAHMNSWNAEWTADLDTMVSDWNAANADIQVEVIKWTWDTYFATMTAAIGAGEAPDVMNIGWGEVVLIGRQHLLDLATLVSAETIASFNEASFKSCKYGDAIYGLPVFEQMNQVLYYRDDFAQEAGVTFEGDTLTWEGLVEAATALQAEGRSGLGVSARGRGIVEPFAPIQYQNESRMVVQEGDAWVPTFDSEESRVAGQYFVDLWTTHGVVNANNLEKGYTELVNDLGLGTTAMFHGVTQNYFALTQTYPDLADVIKIAPPQTNTVTSTIGGAFSMSVFKYTENPEAAVKFVEWATAADQLTNYWLPKGQVLSPNPNVPSPGMPDEIAARMAEYQAVQDVFPFATQWETVRERVLAPRLAQLVSGQGDFDSTWSDIQSEAEMTLRNSE
jgi:ABC-type glycerol-3-phosphate transport system substrate-binding protein